MEIFIISYLLIMGVILLLEIRRRYHIKKVCNKYKLTPVESKTMQDFFFYFNINSEKPFIKKVWDIQTLNIENISKVVTQLKSYIKGYKQDKEWVLCLYVSEKTTLCIEKITENNSQDDLTNIINKRYFVYS